MTARTMNGFIRICHLKNFSLAVLFLAQVVRPIEAAQPDFHHVTIAREQGKFLGWPANHGPMHAWGDELLDGRLALTYAQRDRAQICAKLSADEGATWGDEIVLRDRAGNWDIGYPRTAQRADGRLVTAYYWNDDPRSERHIAATIWQPPTGPKL